MNAWILFSIFTLVKPQTPAMPSCWLALVALRKIQKLALTHYLVILT